MNDAGESHRREAERYKVTLDSIGDAVIATDEEGLVEFVNPVAEALTGWPEEEARGKRLGRVFRIINEHTREKVPDPVARVLEEGAVVGLANHTLLLSRDGRELPIADSGAPIRDEAGKITGVVLVFRDQSEERRMQQALRDSEAFLRNVFGAIQDGISVLDHDLNVVQTNPWMEEHYRDQMPLVGRKCHRVYQKREDICPFCPVTKSFESGVTEKAIVPYPSEDEPRGWIELSAFPIKDDEGRVTHVIEYVKDISDRMVAEEQAKAEAAFTQTVIDAQRDTFFLFEPHTGKAVRWNRAFSEVSGYTDEEIAELPAPGSYYDPEDLDRAKPFIEHVLKEGIGTIELDLVCKDGRRVRTEYSVSVVHDERGDPRYLISIGRDISERQFAVAALRQSEEQYRLLFDSADALISVYDRDGVCRLMNRKVAALFGGEPDDFVGKSFAELHPEAGEKYTRRIRETVDTGVAVEFEDEVEFPTGRRWLFSRVHPVPDAEGRRIAAQIISQDITKRKRAEQALLAASELNQSIINASPIGILIYNSEGHCISANEAAAGIIGATLEQVLRQNIHQIESWKKSGLYGEFLAVLERNESRQVVNDLTTSFGRDVVLDTRIVPVSTGGERHILLLVDDITERRRTEEEREKLQGQLQQAQKMEAVGRLAGGVAHDFNNMLGVILGRAEMIMLDMKPGDAHYEDLEEIQRATGRSASLTNQLLAFARRQNIAPKVLDLNETVEWMLKMLRRLIGEDIDLAWQPDSSVWRVKMDPTQVDQILANLCVNARDAIIGNGRITIETGNRTFDEAYCDEHPEVEPGDYVCLAVSDDGCGMDEETRSHLFEPFFTTKEAGKGTGLGLATIFGIVRQNGGYVNVYSEPGQGSTFRIYIPRHDGPTVKDRALTADDVPVSRGETVLLVEDALGILTMGRKMLERLGYRVLATSSPDAAIDLVRRETGGIDLLLTDVVMPGISGKALAEAIGEILPDVRVLYMSGYTANVIAHHGVLDEGVHFLPKPFSLMTLGVKIREVLDG